MRVPVNPPFKVIAALENAPGALEKTSAPSFRIAEIELLALAKTKTPRELAREKRIVQFSPAPWVMAPLKIVLPLELLFSRK